MTSQVHYLKPGRCKNVETGETRCAMSPTDCELISNKNGERFYNSIRSEQEGFPPCSCETTLIGACIKGGTSMTYECAAHKEACIPSTDVSASLQHYGFIPQNVAGTNCKCSGMFTDAALVSRTKYGACYIPSTPEVNFCAYSSEYCDGAHEWLSPMEVMDVLGKECHCEHTRIGGCVGGFHSFHCAATSADCISNAYYTPIELKRDHNHECYLCNEKWSLDLNLDELSDRPSTSDSSSESDTSMIIGLSTTIAVLMLSIGLMFGMMMKFKTNRKVPKIESNDDVQMSVSTDSEQGEDHNIT